MGTYGGTSVAAALTVGATALLLQQNPGMLVGDEGRDRNAIRLAFQTGWIPTHGSPFRGRIDIAASLGLRPRGVYGAFAIHRKGYIDELGDAPYGAGVGHRIIVGGALVPTLGGSFRGHWVADVDGRVFALEGAPHFGDMEGTRLNEPIIAMAATPTGGGYWLLAEDGGIFSFGDAAFYGSTGNMRLNAPVTDIAATPSGRGYWLTAMDGGVFSFGDAQFYGSTGNIRINEPVVSMDATSSGNGYWLVALDGGIFGFGDAQFYGSLPGIDVTEETGYRIRAIPDGHGYYIATLEGGVYPFGEATFFGHAEYPTDPNNPVLDLILVTG
jgi:hypothetical protein